MKIQGHCHCGEIQYEAELDPDSVGICHCTDCQSLSATAFRTIGVVKPGNFHLLKGEPKIYIKTADSGNRRQQAFCSNCGSGIYASPDEDEPRVHNIRIGTVVQRDQLPPKFQLWCRSAQPWLPEIKTPKKSEKQ